MVWFFGSGESENKEVEPQAAPQPAAQQETPEDKQKAYVQSLCATIEDPNASAEEKAKAKKELLTEKLAPVAAGVISNMLGIEVSKEDIAMFINILQEQGALGVTDKDKAQSGERAPEDKAAKPEMANLIPQDLSWMKEIKPLAVAGGSDFVPGATGPAAQQQIMVGG